MENTGLMLVIRDVLLTIIKKIGTCCPLNSINIPTRGMAYNPLVGGVWLLLKESIIELMVATKAIKKEEKRG